MKLLFLGTGGSMGIPIIGCGCSVCHSRDPRNQRLRPSVLLCVGEKKIVVDPGPDFRTQALTHGLDTLDGVLVTHAHHDHTAGIDDLRAYYLWSGEPLPCLMSHATWEDLVVRYHYIFGGAKKNTLVTQLNVHVFRKDRGKQRFLGIDFQYFTYEQGGMEVTGFSVGGLAFVSDIKHYPESIFTDLCGIKTLVISALRHERSPMHFSVKEALDFARRVGAEQTFFTHISHSLEHHKTNSLLPENVKLAYDGLTI